MKKIFLFVLAAATLFACNKAEVPTRVNDESRMVKFNVSNSYSFQTKSDIEAGSAIGIYAGAPINKSNVSYSVKTMPGGEGKGELQGTAIEWGIEQVGTTNATKFFALYPYKARGTFNETTPLTYTIANDADEADAKDCLVAAVEQNPGTDVENPNTVEFNLVHPFALLRYAITNSSDDTIEKVEIYGVHKTGSLSYTDAVITASGEALTSENLRNMPLEDISGNIFTYYSVIIPGTNINPTIKITTYGGCTSTYSLSAAQAFEAGKSYTASITYNNTHNAVESNTNFTAKFTLADWTTGTAPNVGSQTGYNDNNENWPYVRGAGFTDASWTLGTAMKCVGPNSYRLVITLTDASERKFKIYKTTGNTWLGYTGMSTVNGWTKYNVGDGSDIVLSGNTGDQVTIYYYVDTAEVWTKAGDQQM